MTSDADKKLIDYIKTYRQKGHSTEKIREHIIKQGVERKRAEKALQNAKEHLDNKFSKKKLLITIISILILAAVVYGGYLLIPAPEVNTIITRDCNLPEEINCVAQTEKEINYLTVTNPYEFDMINATIAVIDNCLPEENTIKAGQSEQFECPTATGPLDVVYINSIEGTEVEVTGSVE